MDRFPPPPEFPPIRPGEHIQLLRKVKRTVVFCEDLSIAVQVLEQSVRNAKEGGKADGEMEQNNAAASENGVVEEEEEEIMEGGVVGTLSPSAGMDVEATPKPARGKVRFKGHSGQSSLYSSIQKRVRESSTPEQKETRASKRQKASEKKPKAETPRRSSRRR